MITVNGTTLKYETDVTLCELLLQLQLSEQLCAIEVNDTLVPHKQHDEYKLQDGDNVEIVTLVGGG